MALTADTNIPRAIGDMRSGKLAASQTIHAGALLMRNTTTGHIRRGAVATGCIGIGRAEERATGTGAGATPVTCRAGIYRHANSAAGDAFGAAGDAIGAADVGKLCFIADDDRVARTDGSGSRSPAGVVEMLDDVGVRVRFDEALTAAIPS